MTTTTPTNSVTVALPGPDRKRTPKHYCFQLAYRNPNERGAGCLMVWTVAGGREPYQVALEREQHGRLVWHCTCADATFRGETLNGHRCKHVCGLLDLTQDSETGPTRAA